MEDWRERGRKKRAVKKGRGGGRKLDGGIQGKVRVAKYTYEEPQAFLQ